MRATRPYPPATRPGVAWASLEAKRTAPPTPATPVEDNQGSLAQLVLWAAGLLGVRVGEASHPGPAPTKRERQDKLIATFRAAGFANPDVLYRDLLRVAPQQDVSDLATLSLAERHRKAIAALRKHKLHPDQLNNSGWTVANGKRSKSAARAGTAGRARAAERQSPARKRPQSTRRPPPASADARREEDNAPRALLATQWLWPVRDTLERGGEGVALAPRDPAAATDEAEKLDGGGGKVALVSARPIRRPLPNPDGAYYPSTRLRIVLAAGESSLRPAQMQVILLGEPGLEISDAFATPRETMGVDGADSPNEMAVTLQVEICEESLDKKKIESLATEGARNKFIAEWIDEHVDKVACPGRALHRITRSVPMRNGPLIADDGTRRWGAYATVAPAAAESLLHSSLAGG
eukprot:gene2690-6152_t